MATGEKIRTLVFRLLPHLTKKPMDLTSDVMDLPRQELNVVPARRTKRIAAFLIDHIVMSFLMIVFFFLALGPDFTEDDNQQQYILTVFGAILAWVVLYFAKDSIKGISVGKWVLGIMVRDANKPDHVPSFGRLLLRNVFVILWPVEFIVLALSKEKKRLGDMIAKTVVVGNPDKPGKLPRIATVAAFACIFIATMLFVSISAIKNSGAYKVAITEIEKNPEILKETGGIRGYGTMTGGKVNIENGAGEARLQIKVLGDEKDLNVDVYLTKEPEGEWVMVEMGISDR